jgi:hypothetical protein
LISIQTTDYTVCKPVYETCERVCHYTTCTPVYETCTKNVCYTVCKPVYEACEREECYTVCKPVHCTKTVRCCCGHWETRTVACCGPAACTSNGCGGCQSCDPGFHPC